MNKRHLMLDSNVFDTLIKDDELLIAIKDRACTYITDIQVNELSNIPDERKKREIFHVVDEIKPVILAHALNFSHVSFSNISFRSDDEKVADFQNGHFDKFLEDALIAETAINNQITLVTNDTRFINRVKTMGYSCISLQELMEYLFY